MHLISSNTRSRLKSIAMRSRKCPKERLQTKGPQGAGRHVGHGGQMAAHEPSPVFVSGLIRAQPRSFIDVLLMAAFARQG